MDVNIIRSMITLLCFVAFIGIVFWAYSGKRRTQFDEAANLPFADEEMQNNTISAQTASAASTSEQ